MHVLIGITLNLYIALGSIENLAGLILPISEFMSESVQSEVSQKEKHQYSILMHIYGI